MNRLIDPNDLDAYIEAFCPDVSEHRLLHPVSLSDPEYGEGWQYSCQPPPPWAEPPSDDDECPF